MKLIDIFIVLQHTYPDSPRTVQYVKLDKRMFSCVCEGGMFKLIIQAYIAFHSKDNRLSSCLSALDYSDIDGCQVSSLMTDKRFTPLSFLSSFCNPHCV